MKIDRIRTGGVFVVVLTAALLWFALATPFVTTSTTPSGVRLETVSSGVSRSKQSVVRTIGREVGATMRIEVVDDNVCLPAIDQLGVVDEMFIILFGDYELIEVDGVVGIRLLNTARPVDGPGQYNQDDIVEVFEGEPFNLENGGRLVNLNDGTGLPEFAARTRERCGFSETSKFLLVSAPRLQP